MLAIGNDELGEPLGDHIRCPRCGEMHAVENGKERKLVNGKWTEFESSLLQFYVCGDNAYLCGIGRQSLK